jgi:hypothetical protein
MPQPKFVIAEINPSSTFDAPRFLAKTGNIVKTEPKVIPTLKKALSIEFTMKFQR